ncbi:MAG: TRAP transporter small permease subunit [Sedimenticola sp.]
MNSLDGPSFPISDTIDNFVRRIGHIVMWVNLALVFIIILQVVLRYGFNGGHPKIEELQWHFYALAVMFGLSYSQVEDSHVRVDVMAMHFSDKTTRIFEILGILIFLLPFVFIMFYHSLDFVADSWRINEHSDAPVGLGWRWLIKAVIPLSFGMLGLSALSRLMRDVAALSRR